MKALISFIVSRLETVCFQARVKLAPPHLDGARGKSVSSEPVHLVRRWRRGDERGDRGGDGLRAADAAQAQRGAPDAREDGV